MRSTRGILGHFVSVQRNHASTDVRTLTEVEASLGMGGEVRPWCMSIRPKPRGSRRQVPGARLSLPSEPRALFCSVTPSISVGLAGAGSTEDERKLKHEV